jgi:hypothetical protein
MLAGFQPCPVCLQQIVHVVVLVVYVVVHVVMHVVVYVVHAWQGVRESQTPSTCGHVQQLTQPVRGFR